MLKVNLWNRQYDQYIGPEKAGCKLFDTIHEVFKLKIIGFDF
jgi:hypothetical protein